MDDEHTDETEGPAPAPEQAPVTKVTPIVTEADAAAAGDPPVLEEVDVSLGPFFTLGALLMVVGVLRRRPLALVAGLAAIWVDQRSAFGRRLKERIRARGLG